MRRPTGTVRQPRMSPGRGQTVYQIPKLDDLFIDEARTERQQGIESRDAGFR
jgi:hypothetical protein